ncbi:MAG: type II toxin-antitoxin system RelE/ParE family toxin [Gallionellaceae bacterium]|nr:type II toxin-antitoxin system RelE/ParE family toxin [Gallionellaceae bacterium]
MLPIFWLETADADLAEIIDYIGQDDVDAADRSGSYCVTAFCRYQSTHICLT